MIYLIRYTSGTRVKQDRLNTFRCLIEKPVISGDIEWLPSDSYVIGTNILTFYINH